MEKSKIDEVRGILLKAKDISVGSFSISKRFDFEIIENNDNEIENSILFQSQNEAIEIISKIVGEFKKEEIANKIFSFVPIDDLSPIRIKFNLS